MAKRIGLPSVLGSRGRDRQPGIDAEIEHSERYAARLGRILDPGGARGTPQPPESSDTIPGERETPARP
jgi:hypothetical protein